MAENEPPPSDSPPRFRGEVLRVDSGGWRPTDGTKGSTKRPVPVVGQPTLEGGTVFQAVTNGRLKKIGGIEAETNQATLEGRVDRQVARTARRQRLAIANNSKKAKGRR